MSFVELHEISNSMRMNAEKTTRGLFMGVPSVCCENSDCGSVADSGNLIVTRIEVGLLAPPFLPKSFFFPGVGAVAVPVFFPESGFVSYHELQSANPLSTFPCIAARSENAHGAAMVCLQRFAVDRVDKHHIFVQHPLKGKISGVSSVCMLQHMLRLRLHSDVCKKVFEHHTFPVIAEATPVGDAVKIGFQLALWETQEFIPCPLAFLVYQSPDAKPPHFFLDVWCWTVGKNRELIGFALTGREVRFSEIVHSFDFFSFFKQAHCLP